MDTRSFVGRDTDSCLDKGKNYSNGFEEMIRDWERLFSKDRERLSTW